MKAFRRLGMDSEFQAFRREMERDVMDRIRGEGPAYQKVDLSGLEKKPAGRWDPPQRFSKSEIFGIAWAHHTLASEEQQRTLQQQSEAEEDPRLRWQHRLVELPAPSPEDAKQALKLPLSELFLDYKKVRLVPEFSDEPEDGVREIRCPKLSQVAEWERTDDGRILVNGEETP